MKPLANILLLTDFSELSENAELYALQIGKKTHAKIVIMHVVNTPIDWRNISLDKENLYPEIKTRIAHAKSKLFELVNRFTEAELEARQELVFNLGSENIPSYISADNFDLIIMGSHGTNGVKEFALGSNAQKIIRATTIPTLVVKHKPIGDIETIVFASDFDESQKHSFENVIALADLLKAELHLLYINTPYNFKETDEIEKLLTSFCQYCEKKKCEKHFYNAFNEERGIKNFMQTNEYDLFSIATSGKNKFTQLFSPSLTESIINHLKIPTLVLH